MSLPTLGAPAHRSDRPAEQASGVADNTSIGAETSATVRDQPQSCVSRAQRHRSRYVNVFESPESNDTTEGTRSRDPTHIRGLDERGTGEYDTSERVNTAVVISSMADLCKTLESEMTCSKNKA